MLVAMAKYDSYPLGVVTVTKDAKNMTRNVLLLDEPNLSLRNLYLGHYEYDGYKSFIGEVVSQLNLDESRRGDHVVLDVTSLISFQQGLTQLTTKREDRPGTDGLYHMCTLGSLNDSFPKFDWKRYIEGVFSQPQVNITLTDDQPVVVYAHKYFKELGQYLQTFNQHAVKDYMIWQLVQAYLPYLSERFRSARRILLKGLGDRVKHEARGEICTPIMDTLLPNITGRLYVENEFDPEAMTVAKAIVQDIRKVFKEKIQADSWMDNMTQETAIEKLIGYPIDIMNDTLLDQQFEDLPITDQFFENVVAVIKRRQWLTLRSLHQPAIRDEWDVGPTAVNTYYKPESNTIVIPAGTLREPFFSLEYPKSVIYSSLGFAIAQQMAHGFDNTGRKYDKDGNLIGWWSDTALKNYKQREKCYKTKHSLHTKTNTLNDTLLNGKKTLEENIADNVGIRDAFKAYTEWVRHQTNVSTVPYLGLTNSQVFYLAFAQRWCETRGNEMPPQDAGTNVHSPGALRIKWTLQNSDHFAQTFNCKRGTSMNPRVQKCRIW